MLVLHFSPIATFDALGPSFLSPLCALFFHLCRFPSEPPLCLSAAVSLPHFLSLPSPWFVEVKLLAAWESVSYKLATPTVRVCSGWSKPQVPPNPPIPPPPFLPFTASIWRVRGEFGSLRKSRRSPRNFDCLGGLYMCLRDGRVVGWTSSSYGPMCLYCRQSDWSFCGYSTAGSTPAVSVPFPSYKFPSPLSFRLD